MNTQKLTLAQTGLAIELAQYIVLRLSRSFIAQSFDDWQWALEERNLSPIAGLSFDENRQWHGFEGAFYDRNVAQFSRAASTLEDLGVAMRFAPLRFGQFLVGCDALSAHLSTRLTRALFGHLVYNFFGCHEQVNWGQAGYETGDGLPVESSIVDLRPGLFERFQTAGLLRVFGTSVVWTDFMKECMYPIEGDQQFTGDWLRDCGV